MHKIIHYDYWEHAGVSLKKTDFLENFRLVSKLFGGWGNRFCFCVKETIESIDIKANYFIGVDWLQENHSSIAIAPKLNSRKKDITADQKNNEEIELDEGINFSEEKEREILVDYFAILNECLSTDYLYREIDNLVHIDWKASEIPIQQEQDWLSPLLIVKFLNVLKSIVQKGLKKSYYKKVRNLNGKVKGKILVDRQIKQNVLRNRLANTVCQYDEFGIDNIENRLLKKAFQFAVIYVDNKKNVFTDTHNYFSEILNYCKPAFELIGTDVEVHEIKNFRANPFFKEYNEGIHLSKLILKRYAYNLSNVNRQKLTTPPYWIDMPKLFELYSYKFLRKRFTKTHELKYHLRTYGNELDFLINSNTCKMVIDAKYKTLYMYGKDHQDMRQISGYARLNKIYNDLKLDENGNELIDCLIIYPDIISGIDEKAFVDADIKSTPVKGYRNIYKLGIRIPVK